ncbi:MAG: hypothetical protein KDI55_02375 [Anaerolineae bacterium]|nr:hypothetical protein [Anaerolineae bacterium]
MRLEGHTIRLIASHLNCGLATVKRDLDQMLETYGETTDAMTIQYKRVQSARIEELVKGLWAKGKAGQVGAVDRLVKLFERQAKLLGLDQPAKVAPTNPDGTLPYEMTDAELDAEIKRLLSGDT